MSEQKTIDFVAEEHAVLAFWQQENIFKKSLVKNQENPPYVFYDGPPFATGLPHHGHLLASTLKDIVPRYFSMCGYEVERRFGWDCHGLPIEYEIDKKLGLNSQEALEKLGIGGYNNECRAIVQRYSQEWQKTITRMGRWVDFENDYKTMDPTFMESVWWVCKQLWDKGLIYQGNKIVSYSTALGTVLSNFEASSNYQEVQDPALTVLLKLVDEAAYLAIWTTTPWTLPSNLGVCVGPDITYVKVRDVKANVTFYLAKDRMQTYAKKAELEVLETLLGRELGGKKYDPLFPYFIDQADKGAFQVFVDEYVSTDSGTGLVHNAPGFGEDDQRIMSQTAVDPICPLDTHGRFTEAVPDFEGLPVKEADAVIIQVLKARGLIYDHDTLVHSYPFCPRSDTPLIYRAMPSWYVDVTSLKTRILANNKKIHWVPEHIQQGRFGKWLEGAKDWAISRNRVWGTPIPIWFNETSGQYRCVGSVAELAELTGVTITDLHRDYVDELTFTQPGEPGVYRRIVEVLDCWFESGSMPYAKSHYPFEEKKSFEQGFPAEFIAEGLDQTRGWFYTLMILSTALFDQPAFKNVIVNGIVMAQDGKKMSKRLRNYTPPDDLLEQYGADALRLYLINSPLVKAEEQRFVDSGVKEMVRKTLLPWWNAFKFFDTYATVDVWHVDQHWQVSDHILDRWILSRLQSIKALIANHMSHYHLYQVVPALLGFIDDLTNGYIRLNRSRFWSDGLESDKCGAYSTLFTVVKEFSICMAPFAPFLSETIYQKLKVYAPETEQSVHLEDYPAANRAEIDQPLELAVARMQQVILLGRQKRNDCKIKVKIPLRTLKIIHRDPTLLDGLTALEKVLTEELNVFSIEYCQAESDFVTRYAKPNSPVLGKRLGARFVEIRQAIEAMTEDQLDQLEAKQHIVLAGETLTEADILVFREAKQAAVSCDRFIAIQLDTHLDDELLLQGLAREVINRIQKTRKDLNFNVADRINIRYQASDRLTHAITLHADMIMQETLALSLQPGQDHEINYVIDGEALTLGIKRLEQE